MPTKDHWSLTVLPNCISLKKCHRNTQKLNLTEDNIFLLQHEKVQLSIPSILFPQMARNPWHLFAIPSVICGTNMRALRHQERERIQIKGVNIGSNITNHPYWTWKMLVTWFMDDPLFHFPRTVELEQIEQLGHSRGVPSGDSCQIHKFQLINDIWLTLKGFLFWPRRQIPSSGNSKKLSVFILHRGSIAHHGRNRGLWIRKHHPRFSCLKSTFLLRWAPRRIRDWMRNEVNGGLWIWAFGCCGGMPETVTQIGGQEGKIPTHQTKYANKSSSHFAEWRKSSMAERHGADLQ